VIKFTPLSFRRGVGGEVFKAFDILKTGYSFTFKASENLEDAKKAGKLRLRTSA
jgi:hypothetical protein